MQFFKIVLFLFIIFFDSSLYAQAADTDSDKQQQIQKVFDNWRKRMGIPGAALSVYLPSRDTPITFNSGTTTYGGGENVQDDTLYQAGSITKSFTSTIILKLEAEGKLNIDDSITQYLPQYPQWSNVTIRQLLNHTSGIFNYTQAGTFNQIRKWQPQAEFSPEEIVRIASQHRNYFPPGKGWKYSNTNYVLAGMIIEKITGRSVGEVMNEELHEGGLHLNLPNTFYVPEAYSSNLLSRMAHGYSSTGIDATYDNMSWANTAGAIVTTSHDLLAWWRGLFHGGVLPPEQLNEMMSLVCEGSARNCIRGRPIPHFSEYSPGKGYGLGVIQSSFGSERIGTVWWHNGSTRGYKAIVMWFPKSAIYMALTINRDPGYLLKPDLPIIRRVLSILLSDPGIPVPAYSHHRRHRYAAGHHHKRYS